MVVFRYTDLGGEQQMKANACGAYGRKVKIGTGWLWFWSGLTDQWSLGMKGAKYAVDQFDYHFSCGWRDPLSD
jgi:hypothetical protein